MLPPDAHTLANHTVAINKYKNGNQLNPSFSRTKPNSLHKKPAPQTVIHV